jgi:drug/metabolite transporter (DMT)-like permease
VPLSPIEVPHIYRKSHSLPLNLSDTPDNPGKGVTYYLIHTVLMSLTLYSNKFLFNLNPFVSVLQFTFVRGVCSSMLSLGWSFGSLHKNLIGSVDRECLPSLVFRCVQGALSVFISFLCLKYFSVSIVGIVCSLTPLMVCLLAYFALGEK